MSTRATRDMPFRELAFRSSRGIEVSLIWRPDRDDLVVVAVDSERRDAVWLPVAAERAMTVFEHPFAHAGTG